jgi:hypothetical protein
MGVCRRRVVFLGLVGIAFGAACLPGSGPLLNPYQDDAGSAVPISLGSDDASARFDVDLGGPFSLSGLQPAHGPWTGGTRTTISGRGFSSNLQVWIGSSLLPSSAVFASDPTRVAVVVPPGKPGPVDVRVRNVGTAQDTTLPAGFVYDSFAVTPGTGATTGGTRIALLGMGTHWTKSSTVSVGGKPCTGLTVTDATHISCSTPPNGLGSQGVVVSNGDGSLDQALDAFLYSDSPDGYRGGLYGGALAGTLKVLGFDAWVGVPLAGATVLAGSTFAGAMRATMSSAGVAQLSGASLTGKVTVTVAAKCHQPMTYVDVPVDTVTVYLPPILDPSCGGDPPSTGNYTPIQLGEVAGELVWPAGIEFQRSPWSNVPTPGPNERQVAYVFTASGSPLEAFQLPDPSTATTPSSPGNVGYAYKLWARPGNQTLYALAGLEDRSASPVRFEPYAMGVVQGVPVTPGGQTGGVDIPVSTVLDRALSTVPQPPPASPRGPDRLVSTVAIHIGAGAFAILPQGSTTTLFPVSGQVAFVGLPALGGTLSTALYDLTGAAVTGQSGTTPLSVVTGIETTDANTSISMGGFLPVPTLAQPTVGVWGGTHVALQASGPVDLVTLNVSSGEDLVAWQIVAPGAARSFDLPDLSQVAGVGSLIHGPITTTISVARIQNFDYGSLRSGQLSTQAWNAYAQDTIGGSY